MDPAPDPSIGNTNGSRAPVNSELEARNHPVSQESSRTLTQLQSLQAFSNENVADIQSVVTLLHRIQSCANMRHRFHLFVESYQGEVQTASSDPFDHVITRVLFSPSISMRHPDQEEALYKLLQCLNEVSFRNVPGQSIHPAEGRIPVTPSFQTPTAPRRTDSVVYITQERGSEASPHQQSLSTSFPRTPNDALPAYWPPALENCIVVPGWCPFMEKERRLDSNQNEEVLQLDGYAVGRFLNLEDFQIRWVYQQFFQRAHAIIKALKFAGMLPTIKYSHFTPPWLRKHMQRNRISHSGQEPIMYLSKTRIVLPDLRNQRSALGAKRLAYLLGGFYQNEEAMAKIALDYLISIVPFTESRITKRRAVTQRNTSGSKRKKRNQQESMQDQPSEAQTTPREASVPNEVISSPNQAEIISRSSSDIENDECIQYRNETAPIAPKHPQIRNVARRLDLSNAVSSRAQDTNDEVHIMNKNARQDRTVQQTNVVEHRNNDTSEEIEPNQSSDTPRRTARGQQNYDSMSEGSIVMKQTGEESSGSHDSDAEPVFPTILCGMQASCLYFWQDVQAQIRPRRQSIEFCTKKCVTKDCSAIMHSRCTRGREQPLCNKHGKQRILEKAQREAQFDYDP